MTTAEEQRREAGSLLIVGIESEDLDDADRALVERVQPFGVILFKRNTPSREAVAAIAARVREVAPAAVLAIDHEGGRVQRLPAPFTHFPPALELARKGGPAKASAVGRAHARELRAAGFAIDFAPVLDVHTNPDNPVIGDRAFGTTPEEVIHHALPYAQGLAEGGALGCGKHFPGHGDTATDSHVELPVLGAATHPVERLRRIELRPFARAISQGMPMLMTAHVRCEALDAERPATFSPTVLEDCLRGELGFAGAVVSDDLDMGAVAASGDVGEAAVEATAAGCDLLLVCQKAASVAAAHDALVAALERDAIPKYRMAQVRKRRDRLSKRLRKLAKHEPPADCIGCDDHRRLCEELSA